MKKPESNPNSLLLHSLSSQRRWVSLGSFLVTVHQACEALVLVVVGAVIDRAVATGDTASLLLWIGLLALLFACLSASGCSAIWVNDRAALNVAHHARMRVVGRVLEPGGIPSDKSAPPGELVSLATSDADQVGDSAFAVASLAGALSALVVSAVILLGISTSMGLVVLLGLPPLLITIHFAIRPLVRRAETEQEAVANAAAVATDVIGGLRVIKGLGAEIAASLRYRLASRKSLTASLASAKVEAAGVGVLLALTGAFMAVVALVGGRQAASGEISIGQFIAAVGLTQFLIGPFSRLAEVGAIAARARASAKRISTFLNTPTAVTDASQKDEIPTFAGSIAFLDVTHGSLENLSAEIASGEFVGVAAGGEDAGAIIALLERSSDPQAGVVLLDGFPFASLSLDALHRAVLVAPHDPTLFSGTLAGNVHSDDGKCEVALVAAGADEVAEALPEGVQTTLGEGGRSLSGGQRQRVALARAVASDAPVLVLHDPTTAVDAVTEHSIAERLRNVRSSKTTILITTSPALLSVADRIMFVHEGRLRAEGTHRSLAEENAEYRRVVLG